MRVLTAITSLNLTNPGILRPFDLLAHSIRALSSVAQSTALKGILFAFKMVSILDVAVMIWDEPAVSEVYSQRVGSEGMMAVGLSRLVRVKSCRSAGYI